MNFYSVLNRAKIEDRFGSPFGSPRTHHNRGRGLFLFLLSFNLTFLIASSKCSVTLPGSKKRDAPHGEGERFPTTTPHSIRGCAHIALQAPALLLK